MVNGLLEESVKIKRCLLGSRVVSNLHVVFKNKGSVFEETTVNTDTSQGVTKILAKVSLLQKDKCHFKNKQLLISSF